MRFSVRHETIYRYTAPVRLGDHLLRLTPRPEYIDLDIHELLVEPAPLAREQDADGFGNPVTRLGFDAETQELRISSRFEGKARSWPAALPNLPPLPWADPSMNEYLGAGEDCAVQAFAHAIADRAGKRADQFLTLLTQDLHGRIDRYIRPDGDAQDAARTLELESGACRDVAALFMAACRSLGLPARFVSGYQAFSDAADGKRHLHAWPEVWLPGDGWRGYDPTHGTAITGGYVALAAAPNQAATMPVVGGYWGEGVSSTLEYRLRIEAG